MTNKKRVRVKKSPKVKEDVAANNMGSGNIAIPEPTMKLRDGGQLLKRYRMNDDGDIKLEGLRAFMNKM